MTEMTLLLANLTEAQARKIVAGQREAGRKAQAVRGSGGEPEKNWAVFVVA